MNNRSGFGKLIERFLQGSHHHYTCYLPRRIGLLGEWLMERLFSGIRIDDDQVRRIRDVQGEGIVVYAVKYKSYFDYLFYYSRFKKNKLPVPEIGFGYRFLIFQPFARLLRIFTAAVDYYIRHFRLLDPYSDGYFKTMLKSGHAGLLPVIEKKGFYRWFVKSEPDPIQHLVQLQQEIDKPIIIVPLVMFYSRKPPRPYPTPTDILLGPVERPNKIRRMSVLFNNPGKVFAEVSEPFNLKQFIFEEQDWHPSPESISQELRKQLIFRINRHRQSILGPVLKRREELKHSILTSERLQEFLIQHAKNRNIPLWQIYKKANHYLEEIAAKYNVPLIKFGELSIRWIIKLMYEGVSVDTAGLNHVKRVSQKTPLVLIPCHKSHIDYLILSYMLFTNNMPCPLVAAGRNLSFWPMGPFFRGGGAFFIRRTFRGALLYSKVFSEYIYNLLKEGFNLEFFIEGGRSRTGKLILPKLGLLSIILKSFREGACEDLAFVPIFIGYDRVLEESAYIHELEGGKKEPENLKQVIQARKFLKKRYGRIYLRFHDPIYLREMIEQYGTTFEEMGPKEFGVFTRNLGHRVINAINRVSVVTPHALVASAALNCTRKTFSYRHLMEQVEIYMNYLAQQNARLSDTLFLDPGRAIDNALDSYIQRKFIEPIEKSQETDWKEDEYRVNENKRSLMEYYKNNCISFFVSPAFTALSIIHLDAFQFSTRDLKETYLFLQDLFKNEFAYDMDREPEFFIRKNIKAFIDDAILMPHPTLPERYNITSAGLRKLILYANFLKTYLESYWIVLDFFKDHPRESVSLKDRLKKIQSRGSKMYKSGEVQRPEALSKVNFNNAMEYFQLRGIRGAENEEKIRSYTERIRQFLQALPD